MLGKDMEKLKSFLGTQSELQGELKIKGILRLDGAVSGKIEADQVIISETALIRGEILARRIIVGGIVEGTLKATELLEVGKKGRIQGEIIARKLIVMEGGEFSGQIEMSSDKATILDFESKSQEISLKR